jgi:colicin import membrane protein
MKFPLALALAVLAALPAHAAEEPAERQRLKEERAAAEARFAEAEQACRAKFAVIDCVRRAQRERNAALSDVRRQERLLDDAERKRRAAERLKAIEERNSPEARAREEERRRQAAAEQKAREERAAEKARQKADDDAEKTGKPPRAAKAPSGAPGPQGSPRGEPQPGKRHGPTPEQAAKNRAAYEARIRAAEAHNAQLRERQAKRKKPAADLPTPQ